MPEGAVPEARKFSAQITQWLWRTRLEGLRGDICRDLNQGERGVHSPGGEALRQATTCAQVRTGSGDCRSWAEPVW